MSDDAIAAIEAPRAALRLVGHDAAEQRFVQCWRAGRLGHAWLISGHKGVGKATFAWRCARFIVAEGGQGNGLDVDPRSHTARLINAGTHPACRLVRPTVNATGSPPRLRQDIAVGDVRALAPFLHQTVAAGGWRCVIVDAVDEMTVSAANALLKLLEEPPAQTVIFLICHAPSRLLPTIRSRCQRLALRPLTTAQVLDVLADVRRDLSPADARALARLSGGAPGRAVALADGGGVDEFRALIGMLQTLPRLDIGKLHARADRFGRGATGEAAFRTAIYLLLHWLERLIGAQARGRPSDDEVVAGEASLNARLAAAGALEGWVAVWEKTSRLAVRAQSLNLDRKQVFLNAVLAVAAAAQSQ